MNKLLLTLFSVILASALQAQTWTNLEYPEGGTISSIHITETVWYGTAGVGTNATIYSSDDFGQTWQPFSDPSENIAPSRLVSTSFGLHFIALQKIHSSYDGSTIEQTSEGFGAFDVPYNLVSVADTLYAIAGNKIYKSVDGAANWTQPSTVDFGSTILSDGEFVYANSALGGFKRSVDGGNSFIVYGPDLGFESPGTISKFDHKYVMTTNVGVWAGDTSGTWNKSLALTGGLKGLAMVNDTLYGTVLSTGMIYHSPDTGATWTELETTTDTDLTGYDVIQSYDQTLLLTSQFKMPVISDDGGRTWTSLERNGLKNPLVNGIYPVENDVYVLTGSGYAGTATFNERNYIYSKTDDAWSVIDFGFPDDHSGIVNAVRVFDGVRYTCTWEGLYISNDNGDTWNLLDGTETWYVSDLLITDSGLWILSGSNGGFSQIWTSTDSGANWEEELETTVGVAFDVIYQSGNTLAISSTSILIPISTDGGETWTKTDANNGLNAGRYFHVASLGDTLYTINVDIPRLFKKTPDSENWVDTELDSNIDDLAQIHHLMEHDDKLFVLASTAEFVDGALRYPKNIYVSDNGIDFTLYASGESLPNSFLAPSMRVIDDQLWLAYIGTTIYTYDANATSGEPDLVHLPESIRLHQNYPNPFNPGTTISYELTEAADISIEIFNTVGQRVGFIEEGIKSSGSHSVQWSGENLSSGVYFYRLNVNGLQSAIRQMTLLK